MKRPHSFEDIKGHAWLVTFLKEHLQKGTLPHCIMIDGPEGLGKTSIADILAINLVYGLEPSEDKNKAIASVIDNKQSNEYIRKYFMSAEGGKEVAKQVADELRVNISERKNKVIILDECHGLSEAAQDVFLADTEYLPEGVYLIMLTTKLAKIQMSLQSRCVPIHLSPLKKSEMVQVLEKEVALRNLNIQGGSATLGMIADVAGNKPRLGLSILSAFASGSSISSEQIKDMIGYLSIEDVLPIFKCLSDSITLGLAMIMEMKPNDSIIPLCYELIRLKSGSESYTLKMAETRKCKMELQNVSLEQLITFLEVLTNFPQITQQSLINAFIKAHKSKQMLVDYEPSKVLQQELIQKGEAIIDNTVNSTRRPPTLDELFDESDIIM